MPISESTALSVLPVGRDAERRALIDRVILLAFLVGALILVGFVERTERMYWPYMLTSYICAALVFLVESRRERLAPGTTLWGYLFPKDIWLHRSAGHDYAITVINYAVLTGGIGSFVFLNQGFIARFVINLLAEFKLHRAAAHDPGHGIIIFYTLASWIAADFLHYWAHRLSHKIPWLWEFHKIHHSATVLNPLTVTRAHPIDVLLISNARSLGLAIAAGVFLYFYPTLKGVETVGGINLFIFIAYIAATNLHHTHIWLPYGRVAEHIVMSPAQHQIHHSVEPRHYDRNFASILTVWDWMFGTLYVTHGKEELTFGIGKEGQHYDTLWRLYVRPLRRTWNRVRKKFLTRA